MFERRNCQMPHRKQAQGVRLAKFRVHEYVRAPARDRTRAPASAAVHSPPYFFPIGRHPHPQLLWAGGFVALAFLLAVCLRISPHLLLVRIFSSGAA